MPRVEVPPAHVNTLASLGFFRPPSNQPLENPLLLPSNIPYRSSETPLTKPQQIRQFFTELLSPPAINKLARITATAGIAVISWLSQPSLTTHAQSEDLCDSPVATCIIEDNKLLIKLDPDATLDVNQLFMELGEISGCLAWHVTSPLPAKKIDFDHTKPGVDFEVQINENSQVILPNICGKQKPVIIPLPDFTRAIDTVLENSDAPTQPAPISPPETQPDSPVEPISPNNQSLPTQPESPQLPQSPEKSNGLPIKTRILLTAIFSSIAFTWYKIQRFKNTIQQHQQESAQNFLAAIFKAIRKKNS